MKKLTPKQDAFVLEYLVDLNATQAAIRAGYSANRANAIGCENLTKPDIAHAISQAMQARQSRTEITQDRVLSDVESIKQDAMQQAQDRDGNMGMKSHMAALKAAELQMRHMGMFERDNAQAKPVLTITGFRLVAE